MLGYDATGIKGIFDYFWTRALNSDQTHEVIEKYCLNSQ